MKPVGARAQAAQDFLYAADGTITAANTSQLLLPRARSRSYFYFQNRGMNNMWLEFGGARATATYSSGAITGFTVTNGGFGYVQAPKVRLFGGGQPEGITNASMGATLPDWPSPPDVARGTAVINGSGVVTSITLNHGGSGYLRAPYVQLISRDGDAIGVADPYFSTTYSGILVLAGGVLTFEYQCPTDAIAIVGGTQDEAFTCRYMY